jgi:hypothetical protein
MLIGIIAVSLASCKKDFAEKEENPNRPTEVPPNLVLSGVLADMNIDRPWSLVSRWNQFDVCNYNYYGDQRYDWTGATLNYSTLKNVVKMEEEAVRVGLPETNAYTAIGKFARAFFFYRMTSLVGDLPMNDALKGLDAPNPVYNTQAEIFQSVLQWLEEANNDLVTAIANDGDGKIDGDIYFNSKTAWRKTVNAFRLRVLIALSDKAEEGGLNIKQQFNEIISNPTKYPLFADADDNLQFIYNNFNKYPSNPDNLGFDATRYNMAATYLNNLVDLNDPRAYITAEPATKQLSAGKTPADITAYVGANSGEDLASMSSKMSDANNGEYSVRSRKRYYSNYEGEPGIIIGFAEMCFNIAEAINRGWVSGNAEEWYKRGIRTSMEFYGIPVNGPGAITKTYPHNSSNSYTIPVDFEGTYYNQVAVEYAGNNANGLAQILLQKYLSFFQNSGWEAYFNWRRTGVPDFMTGTGTGNSGRIPLRFQYPVSEQTNNKENWRQAVERQFGSVDDINGRMWIVKD